MHFTLLIYCCLFVLTIMLGQLSAPAEANRVIFFNRAASVQTGQLFVTEKLPKPCPKGQMLDHRNRCRRAIVFGR